jgi:hypothetical protein
MVAHGSIYQRTKVDAIDEPVSICISVSCHTYDDGRDRCLMCLCISDGESHTVDSGIAILIDRAGASWSDNTISVVPSMYDRIASWALCRPEIDRLIQHRDERIRSERYTRREAPARSDRDRRHGRAEYLVSRRICYIECHDPGSYLRKDRAWELESTPTHCPLTDRMDRMP